MQKKQTTGLHRAACISRKCEKVLDKTVLAALFLISAFAAWCVWDIYSIYNGAGNDELLTFKPGTEGVSGYSFDELCSKNGEVVGWITVDDTDIDYPICRSADNTKYVNTDVLGEFSLTGCPFLDFRNAPDFSDDYNLIYGHDVTGGAMFGGLERFKEEEYFDTHTTGTLYVNDGTAYPVSWFALVDTDAYDSRIYTLTSSENEEEHDEDAQKVFLDYIREVSVQYRGPDGRDVIALSTCANAETNERLLLFGIIERSVKTCWKTDGSAEQLRY